MYWLVYVKADGQTDGHGYINYTVATDREYKSLNKINIPSPKVEIASYPCQFRQKKFLFFHEFNLSGSCPNLN